MVPSYCRLIVGLPEKIQDDTIIIYHDEKYNEYERVHVFEQYLFPERTRVFVTTLDLNNLTLVQKLRNRVRAYIKNKSQLDIIIVPVTDFSVLYADIVTIAPSVVFGERGKRTLNFYFSASLL
ncbi:hypothetical protein Calhy_0331 [Caldicellulosiruptor hydrothermalis 108]|uniref:Uncharacterized protein n=1 Tax=Caldicellulosiruptor hydrothermalis (strain DSM 18901 / VKM B-2411 / 108) TaxID=632292 RepID=E4QBH7_CALH1|nr:hypothetical protein [Caldicellulosiruptor hydrothermalis]ADQ06079.1 hypothetical protein Calhy_0331 [Caldicellulosiruptor hydrothermalis 108]